MKAEEHPDYTSEARHLKDVLAYVRHRLREERNLGWSGGADDFATARIREWAWQRSQYLEEAISNPYFGRIDAVAQEDTNAHYIGKRGISDSGQQGRAIIDWRSPIASLFYRPDASIMLKRRISIHLEAIVDISDDLRRARPNSDADPEIEIDTTDPSLNSILGRSHGLHQETIVATIQEDQDRLIRSNSRILVIQGGAGTGKTVIAIHRLAYLLYRHRAMQISERENQDGLPNSRTAINELRVAFFGPNPIFLNFISRVLPDLGETQAVHTTFEEWFRQWRESDTPTFLDDTARTITMAQGNHEDRARAFRRARLKGSLRMATFLENFVRAYTEYRVNEVAAKIREVVVTIHGQPISVRINSAPLRSLMQDYRGRSGKDIRRTAHARLSNQLYDRLSKAVQDQGVRASGNELYGARGALEAAKSALSTMFDKAWPEMDYLALYSWLMSDARLCSQIGPDWKAGEVDILLSGNDLDDLHIEDLAPLAYMRLLTDGPTTKFDHIVVDEAQDISPLQLRVLEAHCPDFTLIGDIGQSIHSHLGVRSWSESLAAFTRAKPKFEILKQGYRSTQEITKLAGEILHQAAAPLKTAGVKLDEVTVRPFPRTGDAPFLCGAETLTEITQAAASFVESCVRKGARSIAILVRLTEDAEHLGQKLSTILDSGCQVIRKKTDTVTETVSVIPVHLAKGMEFDAVAVLGVSAELFPITDFDARILYTAVTRALHYLMIGWVGEPSPLLPASHLPPAYENRVEE